MSQTSLFDMVVMVVGGAALAMQAPVNAALGRAVESSVAAPTISFGVGC